MKEKNGSVGRAAYRRDGSLNRLRGVMGQYASTLQSQMDARPDVDAVLWSARYFEKASMKGRRKNNSTSSSASGHDVVGVPLLPEHLKLLIDRYGQVGSAKYPTVSDQQLREFFAEQRIAMITLQRLLALGRWKQHQTIILDEFVALACALYTTSRRRTVAAAARLLTASNGATALAAGRVLAIDAFLHGLETDGRRAQQRPQLDRRRSVSVDVAAPVAAAAGRQSVARTVRQLACVSC